MLNIVLISISYDDNKIILRSIMSLLERELEKNINYCQFLWKFQAQKLTKRKNQVRRRRNSWI